MTNHKPSLFFAASIRGGRQLQPTYEHILSLLEMHGTVLNKHVADETISDYGETDVTKHHIYDREMEYLKQADVVVAELTTPSLGVGFLVASALEQGKRVIGLYQGSDTLKLSAMIKGDKRVEIYLYSEADELTELFNTQIFTNASKI